MVEESIALTMEKQGYEFRLLVIYNETRATKHDFVNCLDKVLGNLNTKNAQTFICGDINIDTRKQNLLTHK